MRKKSKFNLVDILLILGIVITLAACLYVFISLKDTSAAPAADSVKMVFTVELKQKEQSVVDAFTKALENGGSCFVSEKEKAPAVIKDVAVSTAKKSSSDMQTGEAKLSDVEGRYDLLITLEAEGTMTEKDILADGTAPVKVGDEISVKGKGFAGYGFITSLELAD